MVLQLAGNQVDDLVTVAAVIVSGNSDGQFVPDKRDIDRALEFGGIIGTGLRLDITIHLAQIRVPGMELNRASRRGFALEGTLGTTQHLHPLNIIHLDKGGPRTNRGPVQIDIHRRLRAGFRINPQATQADESVSRILAGKEQTGSHIFQLSKIQDIVITNGLPTDDTNRCGNILKALFPLLRGNDDFLKHNAFLGSLANKSLASDTQGQGCDDCSTE